MHGEKHGLNSPQLYGSRKQKSAIEALITLRVMYNMARLDRVYMVSLFNDLKGCYDRIRPELITITSRRIGCPEGVAVCDAEALCLMKHAVRTSFGISKDIIVRDEKNRL